MPDFENIYPRLPIFLQNLVCSLEGWRINRKRYNKNFFDLLNRYISREAESRTKITRFRDEKIKSFVKHAAETVPYYRRKFAELDIKPDDIQGLSDLECLPVLSKEEVQSNLDQFKSEAVSQKQIIMTHTSGTTGLGLRFPITFEAQNHQWAVWWRYRIENGIEFSEKCGIFGGRTIVPIRQTEPPFWRYNKPGRQIIFSGYHLNDRNLPYYIDEIRQSGIGWLHGYPSHLVIVASYILNKGIDLGGRIRHVTTGAESLLDHQKITIEKAFGVRPKEHYGLAESVANISECPRGNLHVDEDFAGVEFIPTGKGDCYSIVGTNFTNPAFPLLRYDTGDIAYYIKDSDVCPCGKPGRIIESIDGRVEDYVVLRDGTKIGRLDHIFKDINRIREAQFYQKEVGKIELRLVRAPEYAKEDEQKLIFEIEKRLGTHTKIDIEYRDSLRRCSTGKLRFVVSELAEGKLHEALQPPDKIRHAASQPAG